MESVPGAQIRREMRTWIRARCKHPAIVDSRALLRASIAERPQFRDVRWGQEPRGARRRSRRISARVAMLNADRKILGMTEREQTNARRSPLRGNVNEKFAVRAFELRAYGTSQLELELRVQRRVRRELDHERKLRVFIDAH